MADASPAEDLTVSEPAATDEVKRQSQRAARTLWLKRLAIAVVALVLCWAAYYFLVARYSVGTDNAYVNAESAQVTPLISAQVTKVHVSDTARVKQGDLLVELDPSNARIAIAQAEAELAEARRRFRQTSATSSALASQVQARAADIGQAQARLETARADLERAQIDLTRRERLRESGAVSGEELTAARNAFIAARSTLAQASAAVEQARSARSAAVGELAANDALVRGSTEESDPGVLAAKAKLESAKLDLGRTQIRAPIAGVVTKRQVQIGQRVAQGNPIMTIVPLDRLYVDANFKERQLRQVRVGMPATVKADIYGGDIVYHGHVAGLSGGTGASMALIPAQNATGNWIKVVQRLPVRIELDPKELAAHPLRVGLSTEVEIDLRGS